MESNKSIKTLGIIIAIAAVFYGGYLYGVEIDKPTDELVIPEDGTSELVKTDFSIFWDSIRIIKDKYYQPEDIKDEEILYGAIQGAINSLDDPYSTFFKPADAQKFEEDVKGNFGGIGAEIGIRDDQLVVVAPLEGNPAEKMGLKAGDKILKVDDEFTNKMTVDEAVKVIRGEKGTEVTLLIMREGWEEAREFTITRDLIKVPTIDYEMKEGKIAYIRFYSFNGNAVPEFYKASFNTLIKAPKGLILDLRNNSGGYLEVANNITGWFLERGDLITEEKFHSGESRKFTANGNSAWGNIPVVILANGGSASASEILVGAVRHHHPDITVIGETTFGKGTVQEIETLSDGSEVKISVAEWLTPSGESINKNGIKPDIEVKITEEDIEKERDSQLEKALEVIREKSKNIKSIPTIIF
jgi:carboxyl-terminal processing protease